MKLLPLRFIPLGLAVTLLVTLLWVSPAGDWLENTGSIFLLLVLALVFPYLCFIWLTTLMTPPTPSTQKNNGSNGDKGNRSQNLTKETNPSQELGANASGNTASNLAGNIAGNIIGTLTQSNAKKVNQTANQIIDGGDDSSTILLGLPSKFKHDGSNVSGKDDKSHEKESKNTANLRKFFGSESRSVTSDTQVKTNPSGQPETNGIAAEATDDTATLDAPITTEPPTTPSSTKSRSMRIRYRGAWLDYD